MKEDQFIPVSRMVLSNGLRVVHHYMPDSAMVALNVLYGVGARFENPEMTGIAHLFEHIMFGGSANVDNFDGVLTAAGGISNAWTSNDFTNFYEVGPAHNVETLFYLESDRMLRPALTESVIDVQRSVVIEEFKQQCLNVPYGDMMHHLRAMVYGDHPYSWPVIGKDFKGLEKVGKQDVENWWNDHYAPHNAVLSITGNIDKSNAFALAEKWFGGIPDRKANDKILPRIANLVSERTKLVRGAVPASIINIAFLMDPYGTDDYVAADAITDVLSAGRASRFYQRITMNPDTPVTDAEAVITGAEDRGLLMLTARLADESYDIDKAKDFLLEAAKSIITEPVTEHELQRLKNRQKSAFLLNNSTCTACAMTIAEAEIHNETPSTKIERYEALTTDRILATARRIFENSYPAILYYRPLE